LLEEQGDSSVILWLEAVHYLTGQFFNIPEITRLAHEKGCKVGLDLAHAIGNVPLALNKWHIDFAVWCSYKYLSAGPGAISGLYIHEKYLKDSSIIRFSGWWGHNKSTRFAMPPIFEPIPTAEGWQVSNANIFSLVALRQSLAIFDQIDFSALVEKNKRLVSYLETLLGDELNEKVQIMTPKNPYERGCQLSLAIEGIQKNTHIEKALLDLGIICDVRGNVVRVAPMGLYTTFHDVFCFVEKLKLILR
jgi:kynureninase